MTVYIHALREEGDLLYCRHTRRQWQFLSTPSARRATERKQSTALREEGDRTLTCLNCSGETISIHALREEGDCPPRPVPSTASAFLSTPSARRATAAVKHPACGALHFYPRPPRGGRPQAVKSANLQIDFYPRPPRGGRPREPCRRDAQSGISIHALREEGDRPL